MGVLHFDQQVIDFLISLCDETNTPFSLEVKKLAIEGKVEAICGKRVDPRNYDNPAAYYRDNVIGEFLRKFADFDFGRDLSAEAVEGFFANERHNCATNHYMKHLYHNEGLTLHDSKMVDFLSAVKEKMHLLLGPLPRDLAGRFGKGSTFSDTSGFSTIPDKMSSRPTVTHNARDFIPLWGESSWCRSLCESFPYSEPETVRGNRFTSVPKTALGERGICIEPSLLVFWQLAIGSHMKDYLKRKFGYDLYTAQTRHRRMAQIASLTGRWATIDLKDASDLQSYWFVRMVSPDDWFEVFSCLRSPFSEVNGKWVRLEKFSSMGNGFTFELMTVILTAIMLVLDPSMKLKSVCTQLAQDTYPTVFPLGPPTRNQVWNAGKAKVEGSIAYSADGDISVFGDDIICPPHVAELLIKCLPSLGYKINQSKTFLTGPFRESCGGDFFAGVDVRAYNLKEEPNEIHRLFSLANAVRRLGRQHRYGAVGFGSYRRTWFRILDAIPSAQRRLRGPEELGDLVIHDDRVHWSQARSEKITYRRTPDGRAFVRAWVPVAVKLRLSLWTESTQLASAIYGVPSSGPTPRQGSGDRTKGYRRRWLAVVS